MADSFDSFADWVIVSFDDSFWNSFLIHFIANSDIKLLI
jgi:hypothetical protein